MSDNNLFNDLFKKVSKAKNKQEMMNLCSQILQNSKYDEVKTRVDGEMKDRDDELKNKAEESEKKWKESKKYLKNKRKKELRKLKKKRK